jgi:signal peptidase I
MSKTKKPAKTRDVPKLPVQAITMAPRSHAFRETVESVVIAFVLAFLFRTFEAEAFVIPTGSMAPTLMGRHKDVDCPKCGYRYQVSASEEAPDDPGQKPSACLAGMCPMCHYVLPMRPNNDLPRLVDERRLPDIPYQRSYNGDRILVNKYNYTFGDPERWDVVVFKFPGDAKLNYIKRLVGFPGEKLRIYQGDLFVGDENATQHNDFKIAAKPPDKVLAMRQLVHDTDYDPAELDAAGWKLRWNPPRGLSPFAESAEQKGTAPLSPGWTVDKSIDGKNVRQKYHVDMSGGGEAWLHYNHFTPEYNVWQTLTDAELDGAATPPQLPSPHAKLIMDANPYNARVHQAAMPFEDRLEPNPLKTGVHWVGDLMVEMDVAVESAKGELVLELIEGGRKFRCTIDLATGVATLSAAGDENFSPTAQTAINKPGDYHIAFANFDDQLRLWVDGNLVSFELDTAYDVKKVFGDRRELRPQTSDDDPGDLAPVRIAARNAKLSVTRLQVWRDIYYIADKVDVHPFGNDLITDFPSSDWNTVPLLAYDPSSWHLFANRRHVEFPLGKDQFFVMGDNSAESSDARLWGGDHDRDGQVSGQYLERRLLIGKALSVYWPHSWNRIPGTPIPFPLFPNFEDMRLVR